METLGKALPSRRDQIVGRVCWSSGLCGLDMEDQMVSYRIANRVSTTLAGIEWT